MQRLARRKRFAIRRLGACSRNLAIFLTTFCSATSSRSVNLSTSRSESFVVPRSVSPSVSVTSLYAAVVSTFQPQNLDFCSSPLPVLDSRLSWNEGRIIRGTLPVGGSRDNRPPSMFQIALDRSTLHEVQVWKLNLDRTLCHVRV